MSKVEFTVSARTVRLIGRENVANAEGAIIELVKNSYDADAKKVTLKWSIAYTYNELLYFTPPTTLSYSAKRNTIKLPIGLPQLNGAKIKF